MRTSGYDEDDFGDDFSRKGVRCYIRRFVVPPVSWFVHIPVGLYKLSTLVEFRETLGSIVCLPQRIQTR